MSKIGLFETYSPEKVLCPNGYVDVTTERKIHMEVNILGKPIASTINHIALAIEH
jgi:hypothetical protein